MPYVRNIVAQWQPRNCGSMVDFLDSWVNVIPVWILDNILDQLIFPKLQKEVRREDCLRMKPCSEPVFEFQSARAAVIPVCCPCGSVQELGACIVSVFASGKMTANRWTYFHLFCFTPRSKAGIL